MSRKDEDGPGHSNLVLIHNSHIILYSCLVGGWVKTLNAFLFPKSMSRLPSCSFPCRQAVAKRNGKMPSRSDILATTTARWLTGRKYKFMPAANGLQKQNRHLDKMHTHTNTKKRKDRRRDEQMENIINKWNKVRDDQTRQWFIIYTLVKRGFPFCFKKEL